MKKRYWTVMAAGVAGLAIVIGGCSGQTAAETTAETTAETGKEAEAVTGSAAGAVTGTAEKGTAKETEAKDGKEIEIKIPGGAAAGSGKESGNAEGEPGAENSLPLRIWGTIISVGEEGILVDNQSNYSSKGEILLTIDPDQTLILDASDGLPVEPEDVETGAFEAYLGPAMTMSLPPHSTPYLVLVNIPEDSRAPLYVTAADQPRESDGGKMVLSSDDGTDYVLAEDAEILPYLTRNIVTLEDIKEGSKVLLWLNEEEEVVKIVLFAEE